MDDRDRIMEELLQNVEERRDGYVREWLKNPEFRAALGLKDGGTVRIIDIEDW